MITATEVKLRRAIERAGVQIVSLQLPSGDKATWIVTHLPTATQADRNTVASVIAAFSETDPVVIADAKDADAANIDDDLLIQAVARVDFEERQKLQVKAGQTLLTAPEVKARVKAIYRGLL